MAFFPTRGVQETPASARQPFVDLRIPTDDGETLHAWWLEHPEPSAQVLFFHGNGGNLSMWLDVVVELRRRGFSVLAVDYRGYGDSTGRPTERGVYRDADAAVRLFNERLRRPGSPVIYWGRSLGSAAAASAASRGASDALVLESPFPDTRAVFAGNPVMQLLIRVFVVPISHLEVHRTIRAAAARHPRRRRFDHPVRGRQTRVRPRAGRPKDADHDSACRPQRSARGESGDVLAGDRRVRRIRCEARSARYRPDRHRRPATRCRIRISPRTSRPGVTS